MISDSLPISSGTDTSQSTQSIPAKENMEETKGLNQTSGDGLDNRTEKELDGCLTEESKSANTISFSIKRSGLTSKHLDDPTVLNTGTTEAKTTIDNPSSSHRESSIGSSNSGSSPDKKNDVKRRRNSPLKYSSAYDEIASNHLATDHKVKSERQVRRQIKDTTKYNCATDPSHRVHERDISPSLLQSKSGLLVAYNSSDEDVQSERSKSHCHEPRIKKKKKDKRQLSSEKTTDSNSTASKTSPSELIDQVKTTKLPKPLKVVKPTAKSTWDSSDSDFDTSTNRTAVASTCDAKYIKTKSDKSPSKKIGRKHSRETFTKSNHGTDDHKQVDAIKPVDKKSISSNHNSANSDTHRSRRRNYSSCSSPSSVKNQKKGTRSTENEIEESRNKRRRSRSHRSPSHSSRHSSVYSSASSHSGNWRHRRRKHRSKSYSSRSSSRESSPRTHDYRDSTKSSSRGRHRRRRRERLYGHRYRRRSYSSRSHSRSSVSTDSSFRSYRSSRSASSRASTPTHRSPSRQSGGHRKTISSARIRKVRQPKSPPESRLARLGVGPVGRNTGPSTRPTDSLKTTIADDMVTKAALAAVNRVTGGNISNAQNTPINDSHSLHLGSQVSSTRLMDSVPSDSSGLVDIPLPQDGTPSKTCEDNPTSVSTTKDSAPYIGPQLPPDLAKRFGLSIEGVSSEKTGSTTDIKTTLPSLDPNPLSHGATGAAQTNSLDNLIPPEKAEQYRALQEQAKQHALRRNNYLVGGESGDITVTPTMDASYAQQLALLQQRQQQQQQQQQQCNSALLTSMGLVYPATYPISTSTLVVNPNMYTTGSTQSTTDSSLIPQQITQMSEEARLKYLSAIFGNSQQLQALSPQVQQVLLNSVATLHPQLLASRSVIGDPLQGGPAVSRIPALDANSLAMQQLQQVQLQQILTAAASPHANNSSQSVQNAMTSLLVQHALASQQAQRLSAANPLNNQLTATLLAQLQQQRLQSQIQRDDRLSSLGLSADGSIASSVPVNALTQASIPSSLLQLRGMQPTLNVSPVQSTQSQASYVAAILAASQQQQQQQQLLAALRQQHSAAALPMTQDALASSRLLTQQQQQLLLTLQQKQLLQQQQRQNSLAATTDQSSVQSQLLALQQLRQQALAATAIAAAQSQRHQPSQQPTSTDRPN